MASRAIPQTPPSREGRRSVRVTGETKVPMFLSAQKRVQWNALEKKVERDVLKQDQLLSLTKSSFSWAPNGLMTSDDWIRKPSSMDSVLQRLSDTKDQSQQAKTRAAYEVGVRRLRRNMQKSSVFPHDASWDKSLHVSHNLEKSLWRSADPTPNSRPLLEFRSGFVLPEGKHPWKPPAEFPNASQEYVALAGSPVAVPSGKFHKFRATDSFSKGVRPVVEGVVGSIESELGYIPDEGTTVSMRDYKDSIARDLNEMKRVRENTR